jgi:phytoene dehydrogenase-like protein
MTPYQKRTTLIFGPTPKVGRELAELVEAIREAGVTLKSGNKVNEIEVATDDAAFAEKVLNIHGYHVEGRRLHEGLAGVMETLSKKYQLDEMNFLDRVGHEADRVPPKDDKQAVRVYVNSQLRKIRAARTTRRAQHVRDNIDGQITAYENILRYIKKR